MTIIMMMKVAYNKHNTIHYKEGKNDEVKMKTIR